MRPAWRWTLLAVLVAVALAVALAAALPRLIDLPRVQALIAASAAQALGRPVTFGSVSVSLLPRPALVLRDAEVAEDPAFGPGPFLRLPEARVGLRLWPLLRLRVELGEFLLQRPAVALVSRDGRWNIASLGPPPEGRPAGRPRSRGTGVAPVPISRITVQDGELAYESRGGGVTTRYRLGDLDLTVTGLPGPVVVAGTARLQPGDLRLRLSDVTLALDGGRPLAEAGLRGRLALQGDQVRELVASTIGPEPAVAGAVQGTLDLAGTVGDPRASGPVELTGLQVSRTSPGCPEPRRRTLALGPVRLALAWQDGRLALRPLTAALDAGRLSTELVAGLAGDRRVELTGIEIVRLPVERLLVDQLCQRYAITGPLDLRGRLSARLDDPLATASGAGQVRVGPGRIVGAAALALLEHVARLGGVLADLLGGRVPAPGAPAGATVDYETITATYTITDGVLATRDLRLTGRVLSASAAGTYRLATGGLNFDVTVRIAGRDLRGRVTGTAAAPSVRMAADALVPGIDRQRLERGLQDLLRRFP